MSTTETFAATLNPNYDRIRQSWAAQGSDSTPECEDCGDDMTGAQVVDTGTMWVCTRCAKVAREAADWGQPTWIDERNAERRQMGLTD